METFVAAKKCQHAYSGRASGSPCPKSNGYSYQIWFGEGPELSVLRMLGLFDRPADENVLGALLIRPAVPGLTESLTNLRPTELRNYSCQLRRAKLLAGKIRTILGIWIRILWFVNTLANSCRVNEPRLGRNAIGGSIIIIERLRPTAR